MAIDLWNNNVMKWTCFPKDAKNDKFLIIWYNLMNCEFLLTPNSQGEKIISICGNVAIWLAKNDKFLIIWHNLMNCEFLLTPNSQGEKNYLNLR